MRNRAILVVLLVAAFGGLTRFAGNARSVDVVGLFASGMLAGSAITRLVAAGGR